MGKPARGDAGPQPELGGTPAVGQTPDLVLAPGVCPEPCLKEIWVKKSPYKEP